MADFFRKASINDQREEFFFFLAIKSIEKNANIIQLCYKTLY